MGGQTTHWEFTGTSSVYSASNTNFRVYINTGDSRFGVDEANSDTYNYHLNYMARGKVC